MTALGEITVSDFFCGGGGSSTGASHVPGVKVKFAANHWDLAIAVHNANHQEADHAAVDLHKENPRYTPRTDIGWFSPECTKWSQSNSQPQPAIEEGLFEDPLSNEASVRSRLLMFDVLKFAEYHRYRVMVIENVVDIAVQAKYAGAWYEWRRQLANIGYKHKVISLNSMHAQLFGAPAPQSRDRIYIVCWLAGAPEPNLERVTRPQAWCPTCSRMVEAQQSWKNGKTVGRYRQSYVYVHGEGCGTIVEPGYLPALAALDLTVPGQLIGDRLAPKTRARIAAGIARYWTRWVEAANGLAVPVEGRDGKVAVPTTDPLRTQTTRAETAFVVPAGGTWNDDPRTVMDPHRTITTRDSYGAVSATPFVAELRGGGSDARSVTDPAATFCASGNHHALVTPYYSSAASAKTADVPVDTLTTIDRFALVHRHNTGGPEMTTPATEYLRTLTTAGHQSLIQGPVREARPQVTPDAVAAAERIVAECYFRMFMPSEVAAGMAFPATYDWQPDKTKKISNRDLVKMAGNAVTPPCARDIIGAVVADWEKAA